MCGDAKVPSKHRSEARDLDLHPIHVKDELYALGKILPTYNWHRYPKREIERGHVSDDRSRSRSSSRSQTDVPHIHSLPTCNHLPHLTLGPVAKR